MKKAILIIHGFVEKHTDFDDFKHFLEQNNIDVFCYTIPGHEKKYITHANHNEWITFFEEKLLEIKNMGYKDISVFGHSMGGIIATSITNNNEKYIKRLILSAPAFSYLETKGNKVVIVKSIKLGLKIIKNQKHKHNKKEISERIFKASPIALKEFIKLHKKHYKDALKIKVPTLILKGKDDLLINTENTIEVFDNIKNKNKKLVILKNVDHPIFRSERKKEAYKIVIDFLNNENIENIKIEI